MKKITVPDLKYSSDQKDLVSFRLSVELIKQLGIVSKRKGWTKTDLVSVVLDQYLQWENKKN